jgi:hypothetical protein
MITRAHLAHLTAALAMTTAAGCVAGANDADGELEAEFATSPCGVVVVKNTTDGDYCGTITVKNNGAVTAHHWTVEADMPGGARVDWIDTGISFTQSGAHVTFVPAASHASLGAKASYAFTYCNSDRASLLASKPTAKSDLCSAPPDAGPPADTGASDTGKDSGPIDSGPVSDPSSKTPLGKYVLTWYSFQDNTPVNSGLSASGRKLIPYISVAVPFRLLKEFGGKMSYGDKLYIEFLHGRTMPNGTKHTGWVQIDDFCGDSGDDSYCFQSVGGAKYPNTDLYLGDFTKSGMSGSTCSGPAGSGQELTNVSTGTPGADWIGDYGGKALGSGKCGDLSTAKPQQAGCWDYTPPASSASECAGCSSSSCTSW